MLFDRRHKPTIAHHARNALWPRAGWRRAGRYVAHRIRRMPGTPYAIAAGFACGAAISMTPFPGLHFVLAALFAWALGGSIIASAVGTAVGNPWTFPLIWLWIFNLGNWILGTDSEFTAGAVTLGYLLDNPLKVLVPMMVGAAPTATLTWFAFFWPLRRMVEGYQRRRRARLNAAAVGRGAPAGEPGGGPK